jgi:preprotein translocase subunit SecF
MPQYKLAATEEAKLLDTEAELSAASVRRYIQRSTNYVLCVVLFAAALFFAGISTRFDAPRIRAVVLGIGSAIFLGTVIWLATFPVSLSV